MRGLIYRRVSTDEQAEHGFSLAAQEELCRERAMTDGCASIQVFTDDGYSAATLDRPALQRLLQTLRRGDTIYVYRLDRLSRDVEHMALLLKTFQSKVVRISPIVGSADVTTSLGRAFTNMQAVWAQLEREQLGERVSMGMQKRVADGMTYSHTPFGLRSNDGTWEIVDTEAETVRRAFDLRASGYGLHTICKTLDNEGRHTRAGGLWNGRAIWHMLANPAYVGDLRFGKVSQSGAIPAIIDRDLWESVQSVNGARRNSRVRTESQYLLSGLVFCTCGRTMGGYTVRPYKKKDGSYTKYPAYRCIGRAQTPASDHNNTVMAKGLEELVLRHLTDLRESPTVNITMPTKKAPDTSALDNLIRQQEGLETALLEGRIIGERYDFHKARLDSAIREARRQLEEAGGEADRHTITDELRRRIPRNLLTLYREPTNTPQLKSTLQVLIERIEVSLPDGTKRGLDSRVIRIHLRP